MQKGGVIRPSPNEEAEFVRREKERRRVQRLIQVREQSKQQAQRIRTGYHHLCQEEGQFQENMLRAQHKEENIHKMTLLQNKLKCYIDEVGTGHRSAAVAMERAAAAQRQKEAAMEENRLITDQRYGRALKELNIASQSEKEKKEFHIKARKHALQVERHRAKEVASLPPPQTDLPASIEPSKGHRVIVKGVGGFSSTHYNLPTHSVVHRAGPRDMAGPSGVDSAVETTEVSEQVKQDVERQREEQEEKAWLRHKHALAQIRLEREHREGLKELEQLERQYRSARQQQVAEMPANLFQPTQQLLDMKKEKQREMERAFEKPCRRAQVPQYAMEWTLSESSAATPGSTQSVTHGDESSQLDSEGDSHFEPATLPAPPVNEEEEGGTLRPSAPPRNATLSIGDINSQFSDSPHTAFSETTSEGTTPPAPTTVSIYSNTEGQFLREEEGARRRRGQDSLSVGDIYSCFTASPASEATSCMSPATHVGGASLSIIDEDGHGRGMLGSSRQLSAVLEEEGESAEEEDDESTLTGENTDTEEEPNQQPSPSDHEPPPSPPGGGGEDVISSLSSSDMSQQCSSESSVQEEGEGTSPLAHDGSGGDHPPPPGMYAIPLDTDSHTMPLNGLEEMLANIRRQHEAWTDYLADAGEGTLPYRHVTVTRPQREFLPLEDVEDSQVSDPPSTPLSVLSLGESSPESDGTLSSSLSSRNTGFSWADLPEVEPLASGLNTSTAYSLPGALKELSYRHPIDQAGQLGRSPADGATALAVSNTSLRPTPSTSPYPVYPLLPTATAGMSFQRMPQPYQQTRNGMATPLAPPSVIHPRPSPSTSAAPPSTSAQLDRMHAYLPVGPTTAPTVTQPVARPPHQLPPSSTALPAHQYFSHAQPLLLPTSQSVTEGEQRKSLQSAARPTASLATTAPMHVLRSTALYHPFPVATALPHPSPVATALRHPSPVATALPHPSPVATALRHPSPVATALPHPSPVATALPHPSPAATAVPRPSPVTTALPHPSPAATALPHPAPVATVLHTSAKQSQHTPTMFVSPLISHATAPMQQTQSALLSSEPAAHAVSRQPSLPLHHFTMSTPLGHLDASLDSPQLPSMYFPPKPPVFPITAPFHPLPSPGLSSVRSSAHTATTTTAAMTTHRGYPHSPLLTSPISSGDNDSELTHSSSSDNHFRVPSRPPEHRGQVHTSSQPRSEQALPHTSEAAHHQWIHPYGDSSIESSSTSHLSSLSSLTPHGIIQSLLAQGEGKEEGEVTLQDSTLSPLQNGSSHFEHSGQSGALISPLALEVVGRGGSTSGAFTLAQQPDSLPPSSLSASSDDTPSTEDDPTPSTSAAEAKPSMTLQEAFLLKKSMFIQRSQERKKQAMDKAKQSQLQGRGRKKTSTKSSTVTRSSEGGRRGELASSAKDRHRSSTEVYQGAGSHSKSTSGHNKRSVTFSSPVTVLQNTGLFSPPEVHSTKGLHKTTSSMVRKTAQPRAMTKEEIAAVNQRLYGRLPEVQRKKAEQEKIRMNETNRAKAKEFEKKLHDKWKRKQKKGGSSSKPQPSATSKPVHSVPFK